MGLHEENKAERRGRIVAAARRLIAEQGYEALNMRTLAEAARVSVPTLYNLFGGKHAIVAAEMQDTFASIARELDLARRGDALERAAALLQSGLRAVLALPDYYRQLVHLMLTAPDADEQRHRIEDQYIALMAANLRAGQEAGELADWFDAELLARQMFATFMMVILGWAKGDLDDDGLRQVAVYGQGMLLLGVARGDAAARVEQRIRRAESRIKRR
jgi:AcrR family transcriptional regulator